MENITFNGKITENNMLTLNNGSLVVVKRHNEVVGLYMVTSFRNNKGMHPAKYDDTSKFCSLVDLENGYLKFEEPCSRHTTVNRVAFHLMGYSDKNNGYTYPCPLSKLGVTSIEVLKRSQYKMDISQISF